jgi:hypothetical protein
VYAALSELGTEFDLRKAKEREHILLGLKKALDQILTLCWHIIYNFLCFCCIL